MAPRRPLDPRSPSSRRTSPTVAIGTGGTAVYGGYVETPEKDARLTGRERYKTYSDIVVNTSIVAAAVRHILDLIAGASWTVEPNDEAGSAGEEAAELVESVMYDMTTSWSRVVRGAALYKFYGFGVQEWTAKKRRDGKVGLLDIERRPQLTIERWDVDESGTVLGVYQRTPQMQEEVYLPRGRVLYLVDDSLTDSPEGMGLFRHLVDPAKRLSRYLQLEGFGFETDLRGIPVIKAPLALLQQKVKEGEITEADKEAILLPLKNFLRSHIKNPELGLMLDSMPYTSEDDASTPSGQLQWIIELLKSDAGGAHEANAKAIERLNRELARILHAEQFLLGSDSKGSHALSTDKSRALGLMINSVLKEIAEQVEKDVVAPILMLNGLDPEEVGPTMKTEAVQLRDVEQIGRVLADIAQAGAPLPPDDPAINELRDLLGLPNLDLEKLAADAALMREAELAAMAGEVGEPGAGDDPDDDAPPPKGGRRPPRGKKPPAGEE